jgi:signal transduction histidine kinase
MTEEVRRRAFDPFFTTRRNAGGTGLGLHIVHNLVTQTLGGRLTLDTRPGRGSIFRIIIPRSAPYAASEPRIAESRGSETWPSTTISST